MKAVLRDRFMEKPAVRLAAARALEALLALRALRVESFDLLGFPALRVRLREALVLLFFFFFFFVAKLHLPGVVGLNPRDGHEAHSPGGRGPLECQLDVDQMIIVGSARDVLGLGRLRLAHHPQGG
jgi:hypothetical protein